MVVTLIMGIVLAISASALLSLSTTANRNESMVSDEQAASTVLAQLTRDIRSAQCLGFPTGALSTDTPNELELMVPSGTTGTTTTTTGGTSAACTPAINTTPVLWVYNSALSTLTREVQVNSAFKASGPSLARGGQPDHLAGLLLHRWKERFPFDRHQPHQHRPLRDRRQYRPLRRGADFTDRGGDL